MLSYLSFYHTRPHCYETSHVFAPNVSNVDYYDEGHYMVHFGSNGFLHGKVCTKTPVAYTGEDAKAITESVPSRLSQMLH